MTSKQNVYLQIMSINNPQYAITLVVQNPEDMGAMGYSNELSDVTNIHQTAPSKINWEKGKFDDIDFKFDLVAGVSDNVPDVNYLTQLVEMLYNLALPAPGSAELEVLSCLIFSQGQTWWRRSGVLKNLKTPPMGGWDTTTGKPLGYSVTFTIVPVFTGGQFNTTADSATTTLPQREFSFYQR